MGLGLAHKILDTFEKMDAINPTFELIDQMPDMKIRFPGKRSSLSMAIARFSLYLYGLFQL